MRLSSTEPVPVRDLVNFRVMGTGFAGSGSVRSCVHSRMKYLIGIEFGGGLRWDEASFPVAAAPPQSAG